MMSSEYLQFIPLPFSHIEGILWWLTWFLYFLIRISNHPMEAFQHQYNKSPAVIKTKAKQNETINEAGVMFQWLWVLPTFSEFRPMFNRQNSHYLCNSSSRISNPLICIFVKYTLAYTHIMKIKIIDHIGHCLPVSLSWRQDSTQYSLEALLPADTAFKHPTNP